MAEALWTIDALLAACAGEADGARAPAGGGVIGISIDTRTLAPGDLFVALKDQRDGHEFVEAAFAKGAVAALVSRTYVRKPGDGLLIRVSEVLSALERIGVAARARLAQNARIIAVTGSAGKTTTKEMLRLCLSQLGATHASDKSFNNHWGVPLTLARMPAATKYGVFEIGMNHAGEITPLVAMVRPNVAIVTTVVAAHLEHFGSEEAIADAKAEIFSGLEPDGAAILNFDNRHFERLRAAAQARPGARVVAFSCQQRGPRDVDDAVADADFIRLQSAREADGMTRVFANGYEYLLGAVGAHMVANSVAVLGALQAIGADLEIALEGLAQFSPPVGRGSRARVALGDGAVLLIDESYNANPASMRAALLAMVDLDRAIHPRRIAVLGDMLELGARARELHEALAEAIAEAGIDRVFCAGANMKHLFDRLPANRGAHWAPTSAGLQDYLRAELQAGDVVMIKGSNSSRMGVLVEMVRGLGSTAA